MPFTLSHAAAVVPAYRPLSRAHLFSAAVIGSMAPDFGMLLPESLARWQTHSLQALFSFCLPAGLIAWWLLQRLIKPAVIEVLPDGPWARARAEHPPLPLSSVRAWVGAAAGILLGAATHLVWDAFTHEDARGVRMFPLLDDYAPGIGTHPLQLHAWLQYGSSLLGLAVVALALALWLRHAPAPAAPPVRRIPRRERQYWLWPHSAAGGELELRAAVRARAPALVLRLGHRPGRSVVAARLRSGTDRRQLRTQPAAHIEL